MLKKTVLYEFSALYFLINVQIKNVVGIFIKSNKNYVCIWWYYNYEIIYRDK